MASRHFSYLCKRAGMTKEQLAKIAGMNVRQLTYQFNSGLIPFALVDKIERATGMSRGDLFNDNLRDYWLNLYESVMADKKKRGASKLEKFMDKYPVIDHDDSDGVDPQPLIIETPKKTSIAQLMAEAKKNKKVEAPKQIEPEVEAPDFSNVDTLFKTSEL